MPTSEYEQDPSQPPNRTFVLPGCPAAQLVFFPNSSQVLRREAQISLTARARALRGTRALVPKNGVERRAAGALDRHGAPALRRDVGGERRTRDARAGELARELVVADELYALHACDVDAELLQRARAFREVVLLDGLDEAAVEVDAGAAVR